MKYHEFWKGEGLKKNTKHLVAHLESPLPFKRQVAFLNLRMVEIAFSFKKYWEGLRDDLAVKNTHCFHTGQEFSF